ncbi:MAG TPA: DsbA family oxidoreductase [Solirubrobacterales bacterium]|nr:DsbA family oxidoreductase [Solirubrobacterales bacterium]
MPAAPLTVEIWSDIACPWCYLGKRRLEEALGRFGRRDEVAVSWRSFQLQPDAPHFGEPGAGAPTREYLAARFSPAQLEQSQARLTALAAEAGLDYHLDRGRIANTFEAHALCHAAARQSLGDAMVERLFAAQHVEGLRIDDPAELTRLAAEVGLDRAAATPTEADRQAVRDDLAEAARIGIGGVPFFLFDRRLAVSGAQPSELLLEGLEQAATASA